MLRNNGLTEARFLDMMRGELAQRQLLGAVSAGAATPEALLRPLFQGRFEKRSADMVEFPLAAAPEPPAPTEADLQRWYDNHPDKYSAPEYRRIKAVVLSPQTLAKDIPVTDADLQAAYQQHKADYVKPESGPPKWSPSATRAKAKALADSWRGGADWAAMQKAAQDAGGSADRAGRFIGARIPRRGPGAQRVRRRARHGGRSGQGRRPGTSSRSPR